jgi:subtilisin family serine protease
MDILDRLGVALNLVRLTRLMARSSGSPTISIGVIDGPSDITHSDFAASGYCTIGDSKQSASVNLQSDACCHGTYVLGVLSAKRGSGAPAICPGCTLVLRPIYQESRLSASSAPVVTKRELAQAIIDCIQYGVQIINISVAIPPAIQQSYSELWSALDLAMSRGVMVTAAAGNFVSLGSTEITNHPWVIPVTACHSDGRQLELVNIVPSIARRGLSAPGVQLATLAPGGGLAYFSGTSAATAFVTGAAALLWSLSCHATVEQIRHALMHTAVRYKRSIIPARLDALAAYRFLQRQQISKQPISSSLVRYA